MSGLPPLLEEIYATGEVEDADGHRLAAVPTGIARDEALALNALVRDEGAERTLEVGFAYGLSALAIAAAHAERGRGSHVAIDPWARGAYRSIGLLNLRRAGLAEWVELVEEGSETALPRLSAQRGEALDLVLVDGRHHFDTTLLDFFYADRLARVGGLVVVDDADFEPVERALTYILANRAYEVVGARAGLVTLRKLQADERPWDHHVPFEELSVSTWAAPGERAPDRLTVAPRLAAPPPAPRASLSFAITTQGPAARVRALLELVRPHADEIVLAVNRDGDTDTLDACADLADRRLTYEFEESPSRLIAWLLNQCSGDWILRLDDDEVPSRALLEALPELLRDRRPTEVLVKRRWLYRDAGQAIAAPAPWSVDYQCRLLRNVPGSWRVDGRVHTEVRATGESRLLDTPIYHATLLLGELDARRRRAVRYEMLRPGVAYGGLPVNAMYVPEALDRVATEPLPDADRAAVESVLAGSPSRPAGVAGAPVAHASFREVDAFNADRPVGAGAYRARLELLDPAPGWRVGDTRHVQVRVTNLGDETWPADGGPPLILLGYRWRQRTTGRVVFDGRSVFSEAVAPGCGTSVILAVQSPLDVGEHDLEIDVLHEHVRWFGCDLAIPVTVEPRAGSFLLASGRARGGAFAGALEHESARARADADMARLAELDAAAALDGLRAQRRWRLAGLIARPLDRVRRG